MSPTSNKTFEDSDRGGNFLKPNEYFEPKLKNDEIKIYPEHVQYAAQNMRLDLSLHLEPEREREKHGIGWKADIVSLKGRDTP